MTGMFRIVGVALIVAGLSAGLPAGTSESADRATFFVAPDGSDTWSGRLAQANGDRTDGPLATLEAACRAARKMGTKQTRTIVVQEGRYFLNEPLVLTEEDNGLRIVGKTGGKTCLYGGRKVGGWEKDGDRSYSAELPGVADGKWDFRALSVNGRFCPRARVPKQGYFEHLSQFDVPWMSTTGGGWKRSTRSREAAKKSF